MKTLILYLFAASLFSGMLGKTINHLFTKFAGGYAVPEKLGFQLIIFLLPLVYFTNQVLQEKIFGLWIILSLGLGLFIIGAIIMYFVEGYYRTSVIESEALYGQSKALEQSQDFIKILINILTLSFISLVLGFHYIFDVEWSMVFLYSISICIGIFYVIY